ncbi:putative toxin-antitoxin system toxin component, PIN family [Dyadobacter flavalbus]|uniref:Putative toxin-antitoxin system toxin component, PIN family n=2 Tax=Dyadobacter flavalbus TaxID=2579942 RepID=A0A5M8QYQ2_9BACT|nr:putative toxin-antitoxin system toxin component, PIN family [Dyadobacter flavalbus]
MIFLKNWIRSFLIQTYPLKIFKKKLQLTAMPERKINVVIDTNWYISACLNRSSRRILYYEILKNPHIKVFYSKELLQEFEDVISRPKFRKIISYDQAIRFMSLAFLLLNKVTVQSIPQVVRDTDDDYLLGICEHCNADF